MALIFPDIEIIKKFNPVPTKGELFLVDFLLKNLSNEFEIYFQPFINGDRPDIIIIKKNSGVIIIEVKDWDLSNYYIDSYGYWKLKNNNSIIKSPFSQVEKYKENLYNLHIEQLLSKSINDKKIYSIINTLVYFHLETHESVKKFNNNNIKNNNFLGKDSLNNLFFENILNEFKLNYNGNSKYFTDDIYNSLKRYLIPPAHLLEQGEIIKLSKIQSELIRSEEPFFRKIRGVAGSGKTIILANRAVNSYIRHNDNVLILTYNITLKNFIHDNISKVRKNFNWNNFYINNYHNFLNSELNNLGIQIEIPENTTDLDSFLDNNYYSNIKLFNLYKDKIIKYKSIFIDEVQDYKQEWLKILQMYFLEDGGEFIVFGDEKQNVYNRKLDIDKNVIIPGIKGQWLTLKDSFRLKNDIAILSYKFQKHFFTNKYFIDEKLEKPRTLTLTKYINYFYFDSNFTGKNGLEKIRDIIIEYIKNNNINPNDICFLSSEVQYVRIFEHCISKYLNEKTRITFDTYIEHQKLKKDIKTLSEKSKKISKGRKFNFWLNDGTMKFSTIHSFKGLEIDTLFLIINSNDIVDELIYTGLTRARNNIVIININNLKYKGFFEENSEIININNIFNIK